MDILEGDILIATDKVFLAHPVGTPLSATTQIDSCMPLRIARESVSKRGRIMRLDSGHKAFSHAVASQVEVCVLA